MGLDRAFAAKYKNSLKEIKVKY